jgi:osmotically-inducible protein OsmY
MKALNACALLTLLAAAGCSTYPEHQATYGTSYPSYDTSTAATAPYTPSYPSYATTTSSQGSAAALLESDRVLVNSIRQALNNTPTIASTSQRININARNGLVTITGAISSEQDRQSIDAVIRNVSGVRSLDDELQIYAQPTGTVDTRVYSTTPAIANLSSPGSIFNLHVQGLNEPDRSMAQRILQELRTDTILPSLLPMVNITVADGRVTLEGNVQSEQQRQTIESAVRRAAGGNSVNDQLQVR